MSHPPRRSIPAHAGEPRRSSGWSDCHWVYPRPRGGAVAATGPEAPIQGLSPPTRGSLPTDRDPGQNLGSIPAHAGEPPPA